MAKILDHTGKPIEQLSRKVESGDYRQQFYRRLQARYDAAQTTDENERHWANADYLSPHHAMSPHVRRKIASRARYEALENNSYAKGMILTLANDLVGRGPRLRMQTVDDDGNRRVERSFNRWSAEVQLAEKLRTMRSAKAIDGETFAILSTNEALTSPVKLDIRPIEMEMVGPEDGFGWEDVEREYDGIRFDQWHNPESYYVYNRHPGNSFVSINAGGWVRASSVIHFFRADRPGQARGISEIATALPLYAMLRRFTLATVAAAETAADFAAVLHTNANAANMAEQLGKDQWFDAIPIEHRAMLTLPNGWEMSQFKAEHPATTYEMFKREIINEIARCLNMPYNVAAANSSDYNYASGRMDHQVYFKSIAIEQDAMECRVVDAIMYAWLEEAITSGIELPSDPRPFGEWDWYWYWDGPSHVDPAKEANAQATRLTSYTTTLADEYARVGLDWEEQIRQRASEIQLMNELGLPLNPGSQNGQQQESEQDEEEASRQPQ
jgi:lambda family phage portal protein